jgi:hypothetical protein
MEMATARSSKLGTARDWVVVVFLVALVSAVLASFVGINRVQEQGEDAAMSDRAEFVEHRDTLRCVSSQFVTNQGAIIEAQKSSLLAIRDVITPNGEIDPDLRDAIREIDIRIAEIDQRLTHLARVDTMGINCARLLRGGSPGP